MTPARKKTAATSEKKKAAKAATAPRRKKSTGSGKTLMTARQLDKAVKGLAEEIYQEFPNPDQLMLLGIRTRGVPLADRIKSILEDKYETPIGSGVLDITFYRDDLSTLGPNPKVHGSDLPFDLHDAQVVLIDDVLFTGRTVRAALDEIADFGRPSVVRLAILVDRGLRELPIQPDYCALRTQTSENDLVRVMFDETDNENKVLLDQL